MLKPVHETTRTENPKIDFAKGSIPHVFNDHLVSSKKSSQVYKWIETTLSKIWAWIRTAPALKGVRVIATKVMNWLNYYVLSFFNDERDEKISKNIKKLRKFWNLYCDLEGAKTDAGRNTVKLKYRGLGSELQNLIKQQLFTILKKDSPDKTDAALNLRVQEVLDNPFIDFAADHPASNHNVNPKEDRNVAPMARAMALVSDKITQEE